MIERIIKGIIKREGGYINHPYDRGGPTKYGITAKTLSSYLARKVSAGDIERITQSDAFEIYYSQYYQHPRIIELPTQLQEITLDMSVNHGPIRAIKILQQTLNNYVGPIAIDGKIGPNTINAATTAILTHSVNKITNNMIDNRIIFYEQIVKNDETQRTFLAGWVNRAESFRLTSGKMQA